MQRLAIIGSGDLGQLIAHHVIADKHYQFIGFFDDFRKAGETIGHGIILGGITEAEQLYRNGVFDCLMIGIGYKHPDFRKQCYETFASKIPLGKLIHSSCSIDPTASIGDGSVLLPGCVLDSGVVVEENALLNTGCIVAHDTHIEKHSFLGPGVVLAGFITIGEGCFVGVGTTVIDNITIAPQVQTGGGSVVTRNLSEPGLYVGVPAKKVR